MKILDLNKAIKVKQLKEDKHASDNKEEIPQSFFDALEDLNNGNLVKLVID